MHVVRCSRDEVPPRRCLPWILHERNMHVGEAKVLTRKAAQSDLGTDDLLSLASDDSEEEGTDDMESRHIMMEDAAGDLDLNDHDGIANEDNVDLLRKDVEFVCARVDILLLFGY
ncbi:hypothetical protein MUK42_35699 [Musa troglodytarum]|uniref:Uncharacterized protein n=1 Tax=Musa troglodytarum TaxID=320322 RepID=A0A9E7HHQ7_9LILI|nr:hypothetical protein MUK42_35699 [Musa troglodytarum]